MGTVWQCSATPRLLDEFRFPQEVLRPAAPHIAPKCEPRWAIASGTGRTARQRSLGQAPLLQECCEARRAPQSHLRTLKDHLLMSSIRPRITEAKLQSANRPQLTPSLCRSQCNHHICTCHRLSVPPSASAHCTTLHHRHSICQVEQ